MGKTKKILFIKPYLPTINQMITLPMGIMYLASVIRNWLNEKYYIEILDARLDKLSPYDITRRVTELQPDIVGISALSYEEQRTHEIARLIKTYDKNILIVVGGPF